jgi:MFS family permease
MPARDRWLAAWGLGYVAVGAASLLIPLYAISLGAGPFLVGVLAATAAFAAVPGALLWGYLADRIYTPPTDDLRSER